MLSGAKCSFRQRSLPARRQRRCVLIPISTKQSKIRSLIAFTDYLNTECFAPAGADCYCKDCESRRANIPSTAQGFDIGQNIHHTSPNVGNNFPESLLGDSQPFATRNVNS